MDEHRQTKVAGDTLDQMISFAISDEDYGVDIQTVKEVIRKKRSRVCQKHRLS